MEGAACSHDLIFNVLKGNYPHVDFDRVRLVLVNAGQRILKDIDTSLSNAAIRRLAAQKIEILVNTKVKEYGSRPSCSPMDVPSRPAPRSGPPAWSHIPW